MRFIRLRPFLRKFSTPLTVFLAVFLCLLTPSLAVGVEGQKPSKFDLTLSYALKHTDEAYNVSESSGGYDKALAIAEAAGDICDPENDKADLLVFDPVQVFVETNDHCVELYQFVENEGGCLEARTENYCTVVIPFYALKDMGELESVIRVEASQPMAPSMDKSRDNSVGIGLSSTSSVENLAAYKNYDGRGIAVGIIDNGTDVSLDSFKDRYGKTRIDYYWDQSCSKGTPPSGRTYGTEYTASNINAGTALDENDKPIGSGSDGNGSHGTHVAGTVAGRDAKYPGIAPEARIIVVKLSGFNMNNDSGNFSAAVDYILEKASAMGLPCVINCSMGLMFHDHGYDGASVLEKAMQRRVETQNCILCKSSGNENDEQGVAIGSGIKHVWVSNYVGSTHITESSYRYSTIYVYMPSDYANSNLRLYCENSQGQEEAKTITTNVANLTADKYYQWSLNDTTLRTWDTSSSDQTTYPYKLHVTSVEKLDRYGDDGVTDTLHLELRFFHYGANDEYKVGISCSNPDTHYYASYDTICFDSDDCEESGSLSAPIVPGWITVGAYGARKTWKDSSGSSYSYQTSYLPSVKALFPFSSCGPPRIMNRFTGNDEYKPDIIAPGGFMISQKASQYTGYSASRIIDDSHVGMQGTSMSSPMVAGFVALLLQKWPNATADQIKTLLYDKAVTTDTANTGTVPNHRAGHGKLNAASLNSTAVSVPAPKVYTAKRVKNASGQLVAGKMALLGVNFEREATVSINGTALDASNYEYCSHRKIIVSDDRFTSALLNTISANGSVSETAIGAEDIVSSTTSAPSGFNYKIRVTNPHAPSASQTSNWGNEPSSVPYVTGIEKADASSCWVCVINPAVSGTPTVSSGTVTIAKGSSSPVTCAISSYDSAKQAFRVNISNFGALSSYLMGSSVGLPDAYKIAYNRSSDNVSSTAFVYGPFADIAPTQPEAGAYSVVNDGGKRYLKLTGTALDRVDQVSYS
ncbi:S8 family serine peptidase, partial [bacterium]|nr:S8 family serine peptidase [bacterium]